MNNQIKYNELSNSKSGYFECQLPVITETEKAICFDSYNGYLNHNKQIWIPKSQCVILNLGIEIGTRYFIKNWLFNKLN